MDLNNENYIDNLINTYTLIRDNSNTVSLLYKNDESEITKYTDQISSSVNQYLVSLCSQDGESKQVSEAKRILDESLKSDSQISQSLPVLEKIWASLQEEAGFPTQPFQNLAVDFNQLNQMVEPLKKSINDIKEIINLDIDSLFKNDEDDNGDDDNGGAPVEVNNYVKKILSILNLHTGIQSLQEFNSYLAEHSAELSQGEPSTPAETTEPQSTNTNNDELIQQIEGLQKQIDQKNATIKELEGVVKSVAEKDDEITKINNELKETTEKVTKLEEELAEKEKTISTQKDENIQLQMSLKDKDLELSEAKLAADTSEKDKEIASLKDKLDSAENQVFNLNNALQDREQTILELRAELNNGGAKEAPAPLPVIENTPDVVAIRQENDRLKEQIEEFQKNEANKDNEANKLRADLQQAQKELNEEKTKIDVSNKLSEQLNKQVEALNIKVVDLQNELNAAKATQAVNAGSEAEIQKLKEEIKRLEESNNFFRDISQEDNKKKDDALNKKDAELKTVQAQVGELNEKLTQYAANNTQLHANIQTATKNIKTLQQAIAQRDQNLIKLQEQLKMLEEEKKAYLAQQDQNKGPTPQQYQGMINKLRQENQQLKQSLEMQRRASNAEGDADAAQQDQQAQHVQQAQPANEGPNPAALQEQVNKLMDQLRAATDARNFEREQASKRAEHANKIGQAIKRYTVEYTA